MMVPVSLDRRLREQVTRAIRDATERAVVPRFQALEAHAISEKSPGDWVTDADHECEELLTASLLGSSPGSPSSARRRLPPTVRCWTRATATTVSGWSTRSTGPEHSSTGSPDFATMVALVENGVTTASWIWQPIHGRMFTAVRSGGAHCDGRRMPRAGDPGPRESWRGLLRTHAMPKALRAASDAGLERAGLRHTPVTAAGVTYPRAATGALAYALYWRTLPWDHAPGALLAEEAGLTVARLDGTPYRPWDGRSGLLTAADRPVWDSVRAALPDTVEK